MQYKRTLHVGSFDFSFACQVDDAAAVEIDLNVDALEDLPGSFVVRSVISERSGADFMLHEFSINWTVPLVDMHGLYFGGNPREELTYLPFWEISRQTCANNGVPYIALIHRSGENRAAFGLLDQLTETSLTASLSEATRAYHFHVQKLSSKAAGLRVPAQWEEYLFVSEAREPWPDVLRKYVERTDQLITQPRIPVPDHAYDPVFCSWTAIHHDVSHEWIVRNATIAAQLGFKTWITDDGWFIEKGRFADYSRTGDWEPCEAKFPDFQAHVRAVQDLGMRYVLWVSPFMIGKESKAAQRFAHLLIPGPERLRFDNLAPWHGETQTVIANLLERLVRDYHLDGLKIDFIDSVKVSGAYQSDGATRSFGSSIYTTLKCAIDRVLALRPDILIEFRNPYANLASRSYANVYRSSDVPINFRLNRLQAVLLRLLTPDRAVHLDPALWHPDDTDENVAVHLINCLVSVPMVSIELDQYPQSHLDLIRYWIGFYNEHRDTIVHGAMRPIMGLSNVPTVHFVGASETIIGLYDDVPVALPSHVAKVWILNASTRSYIELTPANRGESYELTTRNKFGRIISIQRGPLPALRWSVEVGGSVELAAL